MQEWNSHLEIFSPPQAIENSRQFLLLRKDTCIGNHMISSAIWNEARVNFSKTNKSAPARRGNTLWSLKTLQVLIYSKLHEKNHVITYNNKF